MTRALRRAYLLSRCYAYDATTKWLRWRTDSGVNFRNPEPPRKASRLRKVLPALPSLPSLPTARENIYTIPNILTFSRLVAAPFVGYTILHDHHAWAFGLFAYAGITDLLDGWIARRWNQKTVVGTVIDPMADKTLVTVLVVALATKGALPGKVPFLPFALHEPIGCVPSPRLTFISPRYLAVLPCVLMCKSSKR